MELVLEDGHVVGMGMKDNSLANNMVLNYVKLSPIEMVVHVTHIFDVLY